MSKSIKKERAMRKIKTTSSIIDLQNALESETLVPNKARLKPSFSNFTKCFLISSTLIIAGCGTSDKENKSNEITQTATPKIIVTQDAVNTEVIQKSSKENSGQFYYSYNKEKNSTYNADDSKQRTTIDAYLNIHSPYEKVKITMMIKRLSKDYIVKCSPCHDDYANGVIGPSLLGKDSNFIYEKIMEFKSGKKKNVLMKELISQIDDAKIKSIADEIANFNTELLKMRREK